MFYYNAKAKHKITTLIFMQFIQKVSTLFQKWKKMANAGIQNTPLE